MPLTPEKQQLVDLIRQKKLVLLPYPYEMLHEKVKEKLLEWLASESFPTDNPAEILGTDYTLASFNDHTDLLLFNLSYSDAEQCAGMLIFSFDGTVCRYIADSVECSS